MTRLSDRMSIRRMEELNLCPPAFRNSGKYVELAIDMGWGFDDVETVIRRGGVDTWFGSEERRDWKKFISRNYGDERSHISKMRDEIHALRNKIESYYPNF